MESENAKIKSSADTSNGAAATSDFTENKIDQGGTKSDATPSPIPGNWEFHHFITLHFKYG